VSGWQVNLSALEMSFLIRRYTNQLNFNQSINCDMTPFWVNETTGVKRQSEHPVKRIEYSMEDKSQDGIG